MTYAVISDIHANISALSHTLDAVDAVGGVEGLICLGDVVGFHTSPGECIDMIRDRRTMTLCGNHDAGVTGRLPKRAFPRECWEAIEWTRDAIDGAHFEFLSRLPAQSIVDHRYWLMHGFFGDVNRYLVGSLRMRWAVLRLWLGGCRVGFFGHTHRPSCFRVQLPSFEMTEEPATGEIALDPRAFYLINPGSVGQPRTDVQESRYCLFDSRRPMVSFERVSYDYQSVRERTLSVFPTHRAMYDRFRAPS